MDKEKIVTSLKDLDEDTLLKEIQLVMDEGGNNAMDALDACRQGMDEVGKLFEDGEYFVGDLIYAGEIMTSAVDILKPALSSSAEDSLGQIVLCTVKDDMHDIGKNIVKVLLEAGGFDVVDLGTDVSSEEIVSTCKGKGIYIVALSGVLTMALESMKNVVDAFKEAGMRDDVHIIVGGACLNEQSFASIGADAWSSNPQKTVEICRSWVK